MRRKKKGKEPEGESNEIELLRDICIDVTTDRPVDKPIAQHYEEGARKGQERHLHEQEHHPNGAKDGVEHRVARVDAITQPPARKAPEHVANVENREERSGLQHPTLSKSNRRLVVDVEGHAGRASRDNEHVNHSCHRVGPELREPPPEKPPPLLNC